MIFAEMTRENQISRLSYMVLAIMILVCRPAGECSDIRLLWKTPIVIHDAQRPPTGNPIVENGRLFLITSGVEAYDIDTGRLLWRFPFHSYIPKSLVASNGMVFIAEAIIVALDSKTGTKLWEFIPDANASLGRVAVENGVLYIGTSSHRLYALRACWQAVLGRSAPSHLPRHLLHRVLAYRLQADHLGDLDGESQRLLERSASPETAGQRAIDLSRPAARPPGIGSSGPRKPAAC